MKRKVLFKKKYSSSHSFLYPAFRPPLSYCFVPFKPATEKKKALQERRRGKWSEAKLATNHLYVYIYIYTNDPLSFNPLIRIHPFPTFIWPKSTFLLPINPHLLFFFFSSYLWQKKKDRLCLPLLLLTHHALSPRVSTINSSLMLCCIFPITWW